jgi:hypothetical protein
VLELASAAESTSVVGLVSVLESASAVGLVSVIELVETSARSTTGIGYLGASSVTFPPRRGALPGSTQGGGMKYGTPCWKTISHPPS